MDTDVASSVIAVQADTAPSTVSVRRPVGTIACLILSDIAAILFSLLTASVLRNIVLARPSYMIAPSLMAALVLCLSSLTAAGLYPGVTINPVEELRRSTFAVTLAFLGLWTATLFLHDLSQSRLTYLLGYLLTVALIPVFRVSTRGLFASRSWWGSGVVILGYGNTGKLLLETLTRNPSIGLKPVAILDDDPEQYASLESDLVRGPLARCYEIAQHHKISYGVICMPSLSREDLLNLLDRYGHCFGHVLVIPNLIGMTSLGVTAKEVGGIVGLEVTRQLLRPASRLAKRTLDLAITLGVAPLVLSLVAVSAILIKLEDGGPVLYANERIGYRGRKFKAWKLRSMVTDGSEVLRRYLEAHPEEAAVWESTQKLKHDPRLTRIGKIIRMTSIDEMPQLWNVLIGEMSIVGPRPMLEHQVAMYGPSFELYKQVRPGITGLWQVSGRNKLTFADRVKLDKYVIQNWSVWLDLYILARTASAVLTADGAY